MFQIIQRTFGPFSSFMDTKSIHTADDWPERIDKALSSATVLVANSKWAASDR
jgi:hypothetical protein